MLYNKFINSSILVEALTSEPITESYFGRTKELEKCAQIFQTIVDKYKPYTGKWTTFSKAKLSSIITSDSPEIQEINKLLNKQFGFKETVVTIMNVGPVPNAFAMLTGAIEYIGDKPMPIEPSSKGWYDTHHNHTCAICIWDQLFILGLTGEEILAMVLHEIGHNFQMTALTILGRGLLVFDIISEFIEKKNLLSLITDIVLTEYGGKIASILEPLISKIQGYIPSPILKILDIISGIALTVADYFPLNGLFYYQGLFAKLIGLRSTITYTNPMSIAVNVMKNMSGFSGEMFADSFATAYGYGPEAGTAINKVMDATNLRAMDNSDVSVSFSKNNPLHIINEIGLIPLMIVMHLTDEHPVPEARFLAQIENLERELNQNKVLTKTQKEACRKDLQRAKAKYKEFAAMPDDMKHLSIIIWWRTFAGDKLGANIDIRVKLNELINSLAGSRTYA